MTKTDITTRTHIDKIIHDFYDALAKDDNVKHIFFEALGEQHTWEEHIQIIVDFWETVLLQTTSYKRQSFLPHWKLNLSQEHFNTWLQLFEQAVLQNNEGPVANDAVARAKQMGILFMSKINYYKEKGTTPLM